MNEHRSCVRRQRYLFAGRYGETLVWEKHLPNSSHVEQVSCTADWFYSQMVKPS